MDIEGVSFFDFQSNQSGIETRYPKVFFPRCFSSNRTKVELKHQRIFDDVTLFVVFQSNQSGIETGNNDRP